jgi:hypothetical protein
MEVDALAAEKTQQQLVDPKFQVRKIPSYKLPQAITTSKSPSSRSRFLTTKNVRLPRRVRNPKIAARTSNRRALVLPAGPNGRVLAVRVALT